MKCPSIYKKERARSYVNVSFKRLVEVVRSRKYTESRVVVSINREKFFNDLMVMRRIGDYYVFYFNEKPHCVVHRTQRRDLIAIMKVWQINEVTVFDKKGPILSYRNY